MRLFFVALFSFSTIFLFGQDNLLKMLDTLNPGSRQYDKVTATFKTLKVISLQTTQTVEAGELDFRITHRFGNFGVESNGGVHTLFGWDAISDVRISLDYGITGNLQAGVGRSKKNENIDGSLKWRFLEQTLDDKVPLSICAYGVASLTPMMQSQLYSGADETWISDNAKFAHRMVYTSQLVFARKFANWLSVVVAPTFTHRNYVLANINPSNGAIDKNDLLSLGAGFRFKVSRSVSILADYFYVVSDFRRDNLAMPHYNPLAVGIEIETGGHVFHLNLTNASGIIENYIIPNTTDSWGKGGFKFGFNISRVFTVAKK